MEFGFLLDQDRLLLSIGFQAAEGVLDLGQQVDAAHAGGAGSLFGRNVDADRALDAARGVVRQLARDMDQIAGAHPGHIVGDGLGGLGQVEAQFGDAGGVGHGRLLMSFGAFSPARARRHPVRDVALSFSATGPR